MVPLATLVRVLQDLLIEQIPIRNIRTIVETLAELAPTNTDPARLLAAVRVALSSSIVHKINGLAEEIPAFTLDPKLEQILHDSMNQRFGSNQSSRALQHDGGANQQGMMKDTSAAAPSEPQGLGIEPNLADQIHKALLEQTRRQEETLEASFLERSDGLWGVYRFKRGFGGHLLRTVGPWDLVYAPFRYRLYLAAVALYRRGQGA